MIFFLSLLTLFSQSFALKGSCKPGFESFQETLYPVTQQYCGKCHNGSNPKAPPFAVKDAFASYNHVASLMNFNDLNDSLLVIRSGNFHCGDENCEFESYDAVSAAAKDWWDGGENKCFRNGKYFTKQVELPASLPQKEEGFMNIKFDLGEANKSLKGTSISFDVQNYYPPSEVTNGAFLVKSPRIINSSGGVKIKDVKILLNGKYDQIFNAFTNIDAQVDSFSVAGIPGVKSASPVLSDQSMIILHDSLKESKLSVSFIEVDKGPMRGCINSGKFSPVFEILSSSSCTQCHSSKSTSLALKASDFSGSRNRTCEVASQLIFPDRVNWSPLFTFPEKQKFGHEKLSEAEVAALKEAVLRWAE